MKSINTFIKTIAEILNEFARFNVQIPFYQRNYEWNARQIDTLFFDLENLIDEHFFGTIITRKINSTTNEMDILRIVDGQQRITTSILLLCACRKILCERNIKFSSQNNLILANLATTFNNIFDDDFSTLNKIFHDEQFEENNNFSENFKHICKKLQTITNNEIIHTLLNNFLNKFKLCQICFMDYKTSDEMAIFTSINSKGKTLNIFDLFKSFLLLFCNQQLLQIKEDKLIDLFNVYFNNINHRDFEKYMESMFHYFVGDEIECESSEKNRIILENLKKIVIQKFNIQQNANFDEFKKILIFFSNYYKLFLSIKNNEYNNELKMPNIAFATKMIPVGKKTPIYPLVYLLYDFNVNGEFNQQSQDTKNLIICNFIRSIFPMVINFILHGQGDSNIARNYFKIIFENKKNVTCNIVDAIQCFKSIEEMLTHTPLTMRQLSNYRENNWAIKFLLSLIDWFPSGIFKCGENIRFLSNPSVQLEHIMPQTLTIEWKKYLIENSKNINIEIEHSDKLNMLGNFLLLSRSLNSSASNNMFDIKKKLYDSFSAHSLLYNNNIDRDIDVYEKTNWNFEIISKRTIAISKLIIDILNPHITMST